MKPILILLTALILCFAPGIEAGMQSLNYRIPNSVFSGGGGTAAGSSNYQSHATIGQSSPLMDPADPPFSDNYDLYPGFWYVISALERTCPGDLDGDKDVDGADLADFLFDSGGLGVDMFAVNFGKLKCP